MIIRIHWELLLQGYFLKTSLTYCMATVYHVKPKIIHILNIVAIQFVSVVKQDFVAFSPIPDVEAIAYSLTGLDNGNVILVKSAIDNKCDLTMSIDYIRMEGNVRTFEH